ncbi:YceI family protein [Paraburkholderia silviterrae]|uniref:YceI family protein n=1 Tax=Paraburkholderia silviterrae TaxID=2528715 RepID=A0A4R5M6Y8_9BURK|nr:YceI family protein [Paraburkholderia silviterrae]TDG21891.1 YceI family protein [Paraburkholderia silviterrae]
MRCGNPCATAIVALVCAAWTAVGLSADAIDASAPPVQYRLEPRGSAVTFDVANIWHSNLTMRFSHMRGQIDGFNGIGAGRVMVTIDATSLETSVPFVTGSIEGGDMLDVAHYPAIRFVSTRCERTGTVTALLIGNLTIRATTRPVALAVTFDADPRDPPGAPRTLAISADGHFSRAAFGLSSGSSAFGDDVHIRIQAEFVRERPGP